MFRILATICNKKIYLQEGLKLLVVSMIFDSLIIQALYFYFWGKTWIRCSLHFENSSDLNYSNYYTDEILHNLLSYKVQRNLKYFQTAKTWPNPLILGCQTRRLMQFQMMFWWFQVFNILSRDHKFSVNHESWIAHKSCITQ